MAATIVTLIRRALRDRLLEVEALRPLVGDRVYLNRFEAWDEAELTTVGVYALTEEPIENDKNPSPDERRLTFTVEILSREDEDLEDRLDLMAALIEAAYTLPPLGRLIEAAGGQDTLLKIDWKGNERGYLPEAEVTLAANIMTFTLEYGVFPILAELPAFKLAAGDWTAQSPEGPLPVQSLAEMERE